MITITLGRLQAEHIVAAPVDAHVTAIARIAHRCLRRQILDAIAVEDGTRVAQETADAYSFDRYGEDEWRKLCVGLLKRGLTVAQADALVRSKWTRWAADWEYGGRKARASGALKYFAKHVTPREIDALVEGSLL